MCARRRAQERRQRFFGLLASRKLELENPKYALRLVTLTTKYDPRSAAALTIDALRARFEGLQAIIKAIWRHGLRRKGTGLAWGIECGDHGAVHAHLLVWGPFIPKRWLEDIAAAAFADAGFSHIRLVSSDLDEQKRAVLEAVKYLGKAPSPLSEEWVAGRGRRVVDPVLAARWEVATLGKHLVGTVGVFRSKLKKGLDDVDSDDEVRVAADADVACLDCGAVGHWHWTQHDAVVWVNRCHARGERAFAASRWEPPERPPTEPSASDELRAEGRA